MFPDLGENREGQRGLRKLPNQRRLGSPGPMCRYARDLDVALRVMAAEKAPRLRLDSPVELKKLKVFYTVDNGNKYFTSSEESLSQAVVRCLEIVCETRPRRVTFPETRRGFSMWMACLEPGTVSFAAMFKRFAETLNPFRELLLKLAGRSNHTMASIWVTLGGSLSKDTSSATAAADISRARDFARKLEDLLDDDSVLIFPCSGMKVPYQNQLFSVYTNHGLTCIFNVAMVPVTLDDEGLPVGVQVVAARYQDRICLAVARELESRFKFGWKAPGTIPRL
ncbi:unnamed protein product [Ixodes pacificus]